MATRLLFLVFSAFIFSGVSSHKQCFENPPTSRPSNEVGKEQNIGGLSSYVSGSNNSKICVILISDVFGYTTPHLRMVADKVAAAAGFYTVVPDLFHGDPYVSGQPKAPWLEKHKPEKGYKYAKPLIEALKGKGISKIGAAGFCWGGKVALDLMNHAYVKAGVLLHPTYTHVEDIEKVRVPISLLVGEKDNATPPSLVKQYKDILKAKPEVHSFVKVFPNVSHGWTLRYNDTDENAVRSAEAAHNDMLNWFIKYVR